MATTPENPGDNPHDRRSIRRAPVEGDVVQSRPRRVERELDEDPSDEDIARLDNPTRRCPECRKEVFDDAEICYHCNHAFRGDPRGPSRLQVIVVAIIILGFFALILLRLF